MTTSPQRIRAVASARVADRDTYVVAEVRPDGTAAITMEGVGLRGASRIVAGVLDQPGRHALIRALGGVPHERADWFPPDVAAHRAADVHVATDPDGEETHELYAWNESTRAWLAVSQGSEDAMAEQEQQRYASSRKAGITGAAFWVAEVGEAPGLPPADLGVEVIA